MDRHLLLVLLCEGQHRGDVEHDLMTLKYRVHRVGSRGVAWVIEGGTSEKEGRGKEESLKTALPSIYPRHRR